jgi:hypothetical protein
MRLTEFCGHLPPCLTNGRDSDFVVGVALQILDEALVTLWCLGDVNVGL